MADRIRMRRGLEADIPVLNEGEFGFTLDSHRLYIGSDGGNVFIPGLADGALDGYISATAAGDGYIAFFTGDDAIAGDNDLFYDRTNSRLGLNTSTPAERLDVNGNINASGAIYIADGTSSAPSISFADNKNTGIFSSAANEIALSTNGNQNVTINSTGAVGIGTATIPLGGVGHAKLAIDGADGDYVNGPLVQFTTSDEDNYPLLQVVPYEHDDIAINFDVYNESGTLKSSYPGSNFQILKNADELKITYDSGIAFGSAVTMNDGLILGASGFITIPGTVSVGGDIENTLLQNTLDGYTTSAQGADGYIAFFTGDGAIAGDNDLFYNRANGNLALGGGGRLLLPQINDTNNPTLAFGDGDTGLYESSDDNLSVIAGGVEGILVTATGDGYVTSQFGGQTWSVVANTATPAGTTETLNLNASNSFVIDLEDATGDVTLTLDNPEAGASYIIKIEQSSTTARDIIWPGTVLWPGSVTPVISTGANSVDTVSLWWDGLSYYATIGQNFG